MANITSIGGNPIVPAAVQNDSITDAMLKQAGGVLSEVHDIRTGADDKTYTSAGDAVRGQFANVTSDVDGLAEERHHLSGYVVGALNNSGEITDSAYSISTSDDVQFDYPVSFVVADDYQYRLLVKFDGSTYSDLSFTTTKENIPANTPFKVTVRKIGSFDAADIPTMSRKLLVSTETSAKTEVSYAQVEKLKSGTQLIDAYFSRGSLMNGNFLSYVAYRVATPFVVRFGRPLTFHVKSGFKYGLHTFDESDTFVSDSGWITGDRTIEANQGFKIVVARVTEDTTEVADVAEFYSAVSVDTEFMQSINESTNIFKMPFMQASKPKLIAHMGYHVNYPENTIPAFKAAGEAGMWGVETDIQQTSDGYFICMHNDTVDRTTNGTGNIADMTLAEIRALHIKDHDDLQVPTFEEFLGICKAYGLTPQIEIKGTVPNTSEAAANLIEVVKHYALEHQSMFSGSKWRVASFRGATSYIPYIGIFQHAAYSDYGPEIEFMKGYPNCGVALEASGTITDEMIQTCHENNMPVCTFVLDTVDGVLAQFAMGADMVTTNSVNSLS